MTMQNRISKILTGLIAGLFIAAIVLGLPFSSEAAKVTEYDNGINEYKVFYSDDNSLISAKDKKEIIEYAKGMTENCNIGIFVFEGETTGFAKEDDTVRLTEKLYRQVANDDNGSVLVIDMDSRYIEVVNFGDNAYTVNSYDCATITDNIYTYARNEQYAQCAMNGLEQLDTILKGHRIPNSMKVISNIAFALFIALMINFIVLIISSKERRVSNKALMEKVEKKVDIKEFTNYYAFNKQENLKVGDAKTFIGNVSILAYFIVKYFLLAVWYTILGILKSGGGSGGHSGGGHSGGGRSGGGRSGGGHTSHGGHRF